jgi:protein TonB
MRLLSAVLPAFLVTLALFCLMQYLISSGNTDLARPDYPGFVRLIQVTPDADLSTPARTPHRPPKRPAPSAESSLTPPTVAADVEPPTPTPLAMALPERLPLDLNGQLELLENDGAAGDVPALQAQAGAPTASLSPPDVTGNQAAEQAPGSPSGAPYTGLHGPASGSGIIPLLRVEPVYPRRAARNGEEGWVKLEFTITERGSVIDPVVLDARPRRTFDRSAVNAIRQWRFQPRMVDGKPVAVRATQLIEFRLAGR